MSVTRRTIIQSMLTVPLLAAGNAVGAADEASARLIMLENRHGGRLGVAVLDLAGGTRLAHRAGERFAMCSTFKFLAAAAVLARVDRGEDRLERRIKFSNADLVEYSPVTKNHVADGMTVAEVCDAAITLSDNTAGNLLLATLSGPSGLTAFARTLGDEITRLDRIEPDLNEARPGDPRDTTTPAAMLETMRKIVLGDALSTTSRERLAAWLIANKTGDTRLRAGLPKTWRIGDKTGSGGNGGSNDIAVAWPPGRAPFLIAAYFAESRGSAEQRNAVLAEVGQIVAAGV
jgi:beta-lactamase class A